MGPAFTVPNQRDQWTTDAVGGGQFSLNYSFPQAFPDRQYDFLSELGLKIGATGLVSRKRRYDSPPSLDDGISHVVSLCADKEMVGIDARRVVAGVTDKHACWDRPARQLPCDSVRPSTVTTATTRHDAVTAVRLGSKPPPTASRLVYLRPEVRIS